MIQRISKIYTKNILYYHTRTHLHHKNRNN